MALGYDGKLYILAFDHRGSFQKKMFGIEGDPTPEETERITDSKHLIYEGMVKATETGSVQGDQVGVLVDEQFGGTVPQEAKDKGLKLAMPVEKSGQNEFDFEYGDDFGAHIEKFDPDFSKVLVRYNPEDDARAQPSASSSASSAWPTGCTRTTASSSSSCWCPPPTSSSPRSAATPIATTPSCGPSSCAAPSPRPRTSAARSTSGRSRASTPARTPRCWPSRPARAPGARASSASCSAAAPATRRSTSGCAPPSPVEGFVGFAIGRSIWWDALKGYLDGSLEREAAASQIAENYLRFIRVYEEQETAVA